MRIGLLQLNPTVGDINGNTQRIIDSIGSMDAEIILTPEMSICGYPPRDLLRVSGFVHACEQAVEQIAQATNNQIVIVGHPRMDAATGRCRNSISVLQHGTVLATGDKQLLASYDVFDEKRDFESGAGVFTFPYQNTQIGVAICEDFWRGEDSNSAPTYDINPIDDLLKEGCTVILVSSASPFVIGKHETHVDYSCDVAKTHDITIAMCNQVGANDDLIFDGGSFVTTSKGIIGELPLFETGSIVIDTSADAIALQPPSDDADCVHALSLGIRDYVEKSGHGQTYVGLSGGIDSALTATLAVAALGCEHVTGILMPSRYSSLGSIEDAEALAENLGITIMTLPIEHMHKAFERIMEDSMQESSGIASENVQARIRGLLLMAMANQHGALLLATGNKSELAVGYSTLYGDMAGALSVIGDVYKTNVWSISNWINENFASLGFKCVPIPEASISKAPSAELKPDQLDQDSLPPYEVLDEVLRLHIDFDLGIDEIEDSCNESLELIQNIVGMVDRSQFKRDQASVILKLSPRTFGRGRRMPIVMKRNWSTSRETT